MLDMARLLRKHHVNFDGPNRRGWLELACPKCGGARLGWNTNTEVFFCWYCRGLPFGKTLASLLRLPQHEAYKEAEAHRNGPKRRFVPVDDDVERPSELAWPAGARDITDTHKRYLVSRGLDPDEIVNQWHIKGTTGIAEPTLANRIIAPLEFNGVPVSWQGRSIVPSNKLRYITCADALEVYPSKRLVYGWDYIENGRALVVEGLFDVWKGGMGCVHSFGVAWTQHQLLLLGSLRKVVVGFDNERGARKQAILLAEGLAGLGVDASVLTLDSKDFGEMPVREARQIVKEVLAAD